MNCRRCDDNSNAGCKRGEAGEVLCILEAMKSHVRRHKRSIDMRSGYKDHPVDETNVMTGSFESKSPMRPRHESALSEVLELKSIAEPWLARQNQIYGVYEDDPALADRVEIVAYADDEGDEAAAKKYHKSQATIRWYRHTLKAKAKAAQN